MDSKHTPGPWRHSTQGFDQKPAIVAHVDGKPVSVAVFERRADRNIALAAPEMLEALKEAVSFLEDIARQHHPNWRPEMADTDSTLGRAYIAISKATGGQ